MATTLAQIAHYLDKQDWQYRIEENSDRIITGVQTDHAEHFLIIIQLDEDGEFFKLFSPQVISDVINHPYKQVILETMLSISWETKMLQWKYDPTDGEIRAIIEFPLEDAPLTEKQFNRCLRGLIQIVDEIAMPRLKVVMETGEDPGDVEEGERLLLQLQEQAPGLLEKLEKAMQARRIRGKTDEDFHPL